MSVEYARWSGLLASNLVHYRVKTRIRRAIFGITVLCAVAHSPARAQNPDQVSKMESDLASLESMLDRIFVQCPACGGAGNAPEQEVLTKSEKAILNESLSLGFPMIIRGKCSKCRGHGVRLRKGCEEEAIAAYCMDIELQQRHKECIAKFVRDDKWSRRMTRASILATGAGDAVMENCGNDLARRVVTTRSDPTGRWLTLTGIVEAVDKTGRIALIAFRESRLDEITRQPVKPGEPLHRIRAILPDYEKKLWFVRQRVGVTGVVIPEPRDGRWKLEKADVLVQSYEVVDYSENVTEKKQDRPSKRH